MARIILDCVYKVHSELGPGLLESVYEACLAHELRKLGLRVQRQVWLPIVYDGVVLDEGLRIDMLVEECVLVENKAVESLIPLFSAQTLSYLRLTGHRLALMINYHVVHLKDGIKRFVL